MSVVDDMDAATCRKHAEAARQAGSERRAVAWEIIAEEREAAMQSRVNPDAARGPRTGGDNA